MDQDQINTAVARASDVVNGFKTVRTQQARDVIAMSGVLAERDHAIEVLQKKVAGLELQLLGTKSSTERAEDIMDAVFGGAFGGKRT